VLDRGLFADVERLADEAGIDATQLGDRVHAIVCAWALSG
jgi:hypothetical protein